jgi:hypothetical protein
MEIAHLISVFDIEAAVLDAFVKGHPALKPFFSPGAGEKSKDELKEAYLRYLKATADYVRYSVPMLRASGEVLRGGDEEDRAWSKLFLDYAQDETESEEAYGHHVWALNDMKALGATEAQMSAPPHPSAVVYSKFFVDNARLHPYAVLGTKGVLEHLSLLMCDDLVKGLVESGIPNAENATSFFHHHGILDIEHVRSGDTNLEQLKGPEKRAQVLEGAYFTSGSYRAFLRFCV